MYILGFDIGGTKCAVTTAEWDGNNINLLDKKVCPTDLKIPPSEMIEKLIKMADGILSFTPDAIGISCYENNGKLLICGNGGSCADGDHIVGELMKGFLKKRPIPQEKLTEMKQNCSFVDDTLLKKLQQALPAISLPLLQRLILPFAMTLMLIWFMHKRLCHWAKKTIYCSASAHREMRKMYLIPPQYQKRSV